MRVGPCVLFLFFLIVVPVTAQGRIIVCHDEWTFSANGFTPANAPSTNALVQNIANWFGGPTPRTFLAYSTNFGLGGTQLAAAVTGLGHSWMVSTAQAFTLGYLQQFHAVFLAGTPGSGATNAPALIAYVMGGGNVYLAAGTGSFGSPANEAAAWAPFLTAFGLSLAPTFNGIGPQPMIMSHPVLAGVTNLFFSNGNNVVRTITNDPDILVGGSVLNGSLFGFFDAPRRFQVNQPSASLDVSGGMGTAFIEPSPGGAMGVVNISSTIVGTPYELIITVPEPFVLGGMGATVLPDGQIVNMNLAAPSLTLLNGGFAGPVITGPIAIPYNLPPGFLPISLQLATLDASQVFGVALSAPARIVP